MQFTTIEIFALIFLSVASIKLLVLIIEPKAWVKVVRKVWKNSFLTGLVCFLFAGMILFYLLEEMTIIQIFAVMLFVALLAGTGIAVYSRDIVGFALKIMNKSTIKKSWFYIIIWIILIIWGFKEIFM